MVQRVTRRQVVVVVVVVVRVQERKKETEHAISVREPVQEAAVWRDRYAAFTEAAETVS